MKNEIYNLIFSFYKSDAGVLSVRVVKRVFPDESMNPCIVTDDGVKQAYMRDLIAGEFEIIKTMPVLIEEAKNARNILIGIPETEEEWVFKKRSRSIAEEEEDEKLYRDFAAELSRETGKDVEIVYCYEHVQAWGKR